MDTNEIGEYLLNKKIKTIKYNSYCRYSFAHARYYNVNLGTSDQ